MASDRRVVITGLGVATPLGVGIESFWESLVLKRCGIAPIEAFDPSGMPPRVAGALAPFELRDFIPKTYRKSIKVMARDIKIAVMTAYVAIKDAGLVTKCMVDRQEATGPCNVDSTRFGVNIGAGLICADLDELAGALRTAGNGEGGFSHLIWGEEGMANLTPIWLLKFLPNMLACHVTIVHDAQAPSNTITCAEASGHIAIGEAFRTIMRDDEDVCICGGVESKLNPMSITRPYLMGRLNTTDQDDPQRASRPFGLDRRGMVASEGGGLVILESLEHARSRGARIYGELVGFGAAANTVDWRRPDPKGRALGLALQNALKDAHTSVSEIDLVTPFATGIMEHDASEMAAFHRVFGDQLVGIDALTTRGALGNNGAGTGAIDFAATVMALFQRTVPPSMNTDRLDPECRFRFVQDDPIDANIHQAISLGYALAGGQTAALVIRRFQE